LDAHDREGSAPSASPWDRQGYLHEEVGPGSLIEASAPRGSFILGSGEAPAALMNAGIWATPVMAMLGPANRTLAGGASAPATRTTFDVLRDLNAAIKWTDNKCEVRVDTHFPTVEEA
jgi:hypothetical protein